MAARSVFVRGRLIFLEFSGGLNRPNININKKHQDHVLFIYVWSDIKIWTVQDSTQGATVSAIGEFNPTRVVVKMCLTSRNSNFVSVIVAKGNTIVKSLSPPFVHYVCLINALGAVRSLG